MSRAIITHRAAVGRDAPSSSPTAFVGLRSPRAGVGRLLGQDRSGPPGDLLDQGVGDAAFMDAQVGNGWATADPETAENRELVGSSETAG